jgi:hypothetical protein
MLGWLEYVWGAEKANKLEIAGVDEGGERMMINGLSSKV